MLKVVHGKAPAEFEKAKRNLRATPDTPYRYEHLSTEGKEAARDQLLQEQGHLCAYCMRRIGTESSGARIEHWLPQSDNPGKTSLDYRNMLAVCDGGGSGARPSSQTCDVRKGYHPIELDPRNEQHIRTLFYSSDGLIRSSNVVFQNEIDEQLNLNAKCTLLPKNRMAALQLAEKMIRDVYDRHPQNTKAARSEIQKKIDRLEERTEYRDEFVGVVIWRLKDHLRRHRS